MKKLTVWMLALVMGLSLAGCGDRKAPAEPEPETPAPVQIRQESPFSFEGAVFTYEGQDYDLSEKGISEILSVSPVGDVLMIEGSFGPDSTRYFLYNTADGTMQEELMGNNMIWQEGDVDTAVYAFDGAIYRLDGTQVGQLDLGEGEFVYDLSFTEDNGAVTVTVINADGEIRSQDLPL